MDSKRSLFEIFAALSCFGIILSLVRPGTVLISKRCGLSLTIIKSILTTPIKFNFWYRSMEILLIIFFVSSNILAGVISSALPWYLAS